MSYKYANYFFLHLQILPIDFSATDSKIESDPNFQFLIYQPTLAGHNELQNDNTKSNIFTFYFKKCGRIIE